MRKWISMMMMVAMVVSTTMPAVSHAAMNHEHAEQSTHTDTAAHDEMAGMDCDHHAEKASHDTHDSKDKPCCEKGVCKCLNGSCHGGLATIPGKDGDALLAFNGNTAQFALAGQFIESATLARLKRPPKA